MMIKKIFLIEKTKQKKLLEVLSGGVLFYEEKK